MRCEDPVNVWQRVAGRGDRELCAQLDRARANLMKRPELALALAQGVLEKRPHEEQALLLLAHANWQLGKPAEAYQQFLALASRTPRGAERPMAAVHLWARARAAVQVSEYEQARAWYRHLLLALEALPSSTERACALLEAAWVSLYAGENYAEAQGYLRRAQEEDAAIWGEVARGAEVVTATLMGELSSAESAQLYARLAWLFEQETRTKRPILFLPRLGTEVLLAHLALLSDRPRAEQHLSILACEGGLPAHMSARLSPGSDAGCPNDERLDAEWTDLGPGQ